MTALLALALATAPAALSTPDPYEGLYACTATSDPHVVWIGTVGTGTRAEPMWAVYTLNFPEEYPIGEQIRATRGSSYHTRGGTFNPGDSRIDFDTGRLRLWDEPCEAVATVRDVLTRLGLDPADAVQEVQDLEGWTAEQVGARLDDAGFADAVFRADADYPTRGGPTFAQLLLGATLAEPPPPPNAAPAAVPEAADAYEGVYSDGRMLYVVRDGRFVQFTHAPDDDWVEGFQYVFEPRGYMLRAYDYQVVDGEFQSGDTSEMEFLRRGGEVAALVWRGQELPRVYTVRQMYEGAPSLNLAYLVDQIREDHGLTDAEIDAALDDAGRFAEVVREGMAPITLGMLLGLDG